MEMSPNGLALWDFLQLVSCPEVYFLLACSLRQALELSQSTQSLGQEVCILRSPFLSNPNHTQSSSPQGGSISAPSSSSVPSSLCRSS